MPLFVVTVMAQLVLCGGMVPVTGRLGLDQLSFAMPARWGYAAAASTVDLRHLVPDSLLSQDRFWQHTSKIWLLDMGMLAALSLFYAGFVRWRIRLRRYEVTSSIRRSTRRSTCSPAPTPIPRASCGPSTSTRCSRGGST